MSYLRGYKVAMDIPSDRVGNELNFARGLLDGLRVRATSKSTSERMERVLLVAENDDRGKWTALGLDVTIVVFGDSQHHAVMRYKNAVHRKPRNVPMQKHEELFASAERVFVPGLDVRAASSE